MRMAGSKCARLSQVLKSQSAVPLTLSGSLCHQPSQHSLAPLYLHNPSSSGLPFTTPNISQTQCALTYILTFSDSQRSSSVSPLFLVPALRRSCNEGLYISTQLRPTELTLSPRRSPAICSSQSASIQSINLPVFHLPGCLCLDL